MDGVLQVFIGGALVAASCPPHVSTLDASVARVHHIPGQSAGICFVRLPKPLRAPPMLV
jgi:hypothetical protein